ncbi:hypothetical protein [Streptomyces sp. ADI98-10]|uniref:hypothetical protein n=1 Tax=Streptomyces sp. ADI98-10 TaxID=1522763 RepID=UPI000F557E09|nr:hypothetical protein [Streptomyces sp. ADI98-10]
MNEYAVLGAMADKADPDGCGTWLSKDTIAARVHVSDETVKRCWRNMTKRGLIARGDQNLVRHYRADRRPVVYDLLIPFDWFSNIDRINAERDRLGRPPLTRADRPPIDPAPAKKARGDKGKARPKKTAPAPDQEATERGNSETPREGDPPPPHGGTVSRRRGNYKSSTGELEDPQHSKNNQSKNTGNNDGPPVRPSVPAGDDVREAQAPAARTDGRGGGIEEDQEDGPVPAGNGPADHGTAGDPAPAAGPEAKDAARAGGAQTGGPVRVDASPGVELLGAIGAAQPELLLTGRTLRDQGLMVTGLLEAGWPVPLLLEVITRPLPDPLLRTVGAVISGRLKAAASMPVPGSAAGAAVVPHQAPGPDRTAPGEERRWDDAPTPTATPYAELERQQDQVRRGIDLNPGCEADDGLCPTLAVVGETRCALHLGWPLCPGLDGYTCTVRTRTGDQCATCQEEARSARIDAALPVAETDDGTCPGHGSPCGRAALPGDPLCARCRVASQRDRDRVLREWEAVRDAAVAAAHAQEAPQEAPAPF